VVMNALDDAGKMLSEKEKECEMTQDK
jgi:hypothetical protein